MKFADFRPDIPRAARVWLAVCLMSPIGLAQADEPAPQSSPSNNEWTIVIQPGPIAQVSSSVTELPIPPLPAQAVGDQLASASQFAPALLANQTNDAPATPEAVEEEEVVMSPPDESRAGQRMSYREAYDAIPFSRSEYNANPSYRHEAAMELMFGQLRPMTTVKYVPVSAPPQMSYVTPYRYRRNGYGVNYNFYYPRPTVYRAY